MDIKHIKGEKPHYSLEKCKLKLKYDTSIHSLDSLILKRTCDSKCW